MYVSKFSELIIWEKGHFRCRNLKVPNIMWHVYECCILIFLEKKSYFLKLLFIEEECGFLLVMVLLQSPLYCLRKYVLTSPKNICAGCGGTGNIMCSECGGRGHVWSQPFSSICSEQAYTYPQNTSHVCGLFVIGCWLLYSEQTAVKPSCNVIG